MLFLLLGLGCFSKVPSSPKTPIVQTIQKEDLLKHATELSSDEYLGRGTLEPGLDKAANYIANEYQKLGLQPYPQQQSFLMPYTLFQSGWATDGHLKATQNEAL